MWYGNFIVPTPSIRVWYDQVEWCSNQGWRKLQDFKCGWLKIREQADAEWFMLRWAS